MASDLTHVGGDVEQDKKGKKKRGQIVEKSMSREDVGDVEVRLARAELAIADGQDRFNELDAQWEEHDSRMKALEEEHGELRGEVQARLNLGVEETSKSGDTLRTLFGELNSLREENAMLKEELKRLMAEMTLVKIAVAQDKGASSSNPIITPSRVDVPRPKAYYGARNAKEIDNFLWSLEQYFKASGITGDAHKIDHATLYLEDTAKLWWRRRYADVEKGVREGEELKVRGERVG
ncbi:hypothetical protein AKJ16_DCAP04423 [Drosera capensis]